MPPATSALRVRNVLRLKPMLPPLPFELVLAIFSVLSMIPNPVLIAELVTHLTMNNDFNAAITSVFHHFAHCLKRNPYGAPHHRLYRRSNETYTLYAVGDSGKKPSLLRRSRRDSARHRGRFDQVGEVAVKRGEAFDKSFGVACWNSRDRTNGSLRRQSRPAARERAHRCA